MRETKAPFEKKLFLKILWNSIWKYFGMKAANKIGLWLVDYNIQKNYGILRCSHNTKEKVITALTLIKQSENERIIISPIKTAGTIKAIKKVAAEIII